MGLRRLTYLVVIVTFVARCASAPSAEDTDHTVRRITVLVEQKKLAEALDALKSSGHCDNAALIGSNCGAWTINYELEGAPVQFRTVDLEHAYESGISFGQGNAGTDMLKKVVRLMASLNDCSKKAEDEELKKCLLGHVLDYGTGGANDKLARFTNFTCSNEQKFMNPSGDMSGNFFYSAADVFVMKSAVGQNWGPVKKVRAALCKS